METTPTTSMRTTKGGRLWAFLTAIVLAVSALAIPSFAASPECGCTKTGPYEDPVTKKPVAEATSPGGGEFTLSTAQTATDVTLTIRRAATNALVRNITLRLSRVAWGFSPDGKRFVVRQAFPTGDFPAQIDEITLFDLVQNKQVYTNNVTAGASIAFSPHGRWFFLNVLNAPGQAEVIVRDAATGAQALYDSILFENVPGVPGDKFGSIRLGFSPDAGDRSFVWAYRQPGGNVQLTARNLETGTTIMSLPVGGSSWWQFSPCGDALGLVNQQQPDSVDVTLYRTARFNQQIGSTNTFTPLPDHIELTTTSADHRITTTVNSQVTTTIVGPNTAGSACPAPGALSSLTVAPSSVNGGSNATGTIELSAPAVAALTVALSSSDTSAATVPATVTLGAGALSKPFPVTTSAVTADKTVTITAKSGSVTRTSTLTVKAVPAGPSLDNLSLDPTRVTGGTPGSGTVTLTGPALAGGTAVTLSSSAPDVASVPASVTVPAGQSSTTFPIVTSPVPGDAPATITASATGFVRSLRLMVLTTDRGCNPGYTDPATETLKVRSQAAFDDLGQDADCITPMSFGNGITVGSGKSGLPVGTPVKLVVNLRFDGVSYTSPPVGNGGALAEGSANYQIVDESVPPDGEASNVPVSFRADFTLRQSHYDPQVSKASNFSLLTNVGDPQESRTSEDASSSDAASMVADTGALTAVYETTVGAHLTVSGRVSTVASAYGSGASAVADFSHTFDATTVPAPGFESLALSYDTDPPTPPANQAPVCGDGSLTTDAGKAVSGQVSCTDLDGDAISFTVTTSPNHGTLSPISGSGGFTYTPAAGYVGTDSFSVQASDNRGGTATSTQTVTVRKVVVGPPASKHECKDGGWQKFDNPTFKNQGQCVSYVSTRK